MELDQSSIDNLIFGIVRDLDGHGFSKTATRQDINELVLNHFRDHISDYVLPAIQRLVQSERIVEDRDTSQGRPYRYYLPRET
jgi:hypothetical protein